MRTVLIILVILHGLIHLTGFVKGFGFAEVKALTLPISRPMGLAWLSASVLVLAFGITYTGKSDYAWLIGFLAVAISQLLIFLYWKDARFGTIANLIILLLSLAAFGRFRFEQMVKQETSHLLQQNRGATGGIVTETDILYLPGPVRNWLRASGQVGKPHIHTGKVWQRAEMKMKPGQEKWMTATAVQYTTLQTPGFIWTVDAAMNGFIGFTGRDKYESGRGEMWIRLYSLFTVVRAAGEKMDEATVQRYLGEMVWFPSLALRPFIQWEQLNDSTARATMEYQGIRASGDFTFNAAGDFIRYSALRYRGNEPEAKRQEWVLEVKEHKSFAGIRVPSLMSATWKLGSGDWTWLQLEITSLKFNGEALGQFNQQNNQQ